MKFHLTLISHNRKTGPIPVSTSSQETCPSVCPFKNNGCYASSFPLRIHWEAVTKGNRGDDFDVFCNKIKYTICKDQLWRYGQAGDLPGDGVSIDFELLQQLVGANIGRRGFTYTHYLPVGANAAAISKANLGGFTINLSANNLSHADELCDLGIGPVVTVLPDRMDIGDIRTPAGRKVVVCPATYTDTNCMRCGLCQVVNRSVVVGFPAHGVSKKKVINVFLSGGV